MIKMKLFFLLLALSFSISCKSTYALKATGEQISISLKNGDKILVELLSVQERQLFIKKEGQLYTIPFEQVSKLYIKGGHEPSARNAGYLSLGVINGLPGLAIISRRDGRVVGGGLLALSAVAFVTMGNSPYKFKFPLSMDQLEQLKLQASYPLGLVEEQKQQLLLYYGQADFLKL